MRLTRYIPRRLVRVLQYLAILAVLSVCLPTLISWNSPEKPTVPSVHKEINHQGVFVAPPDEHQVVMQNANNELEKKDYVGSNKGTGQERDYLLRSKDIKVVADHGDEIDPSLRYQGQISDKDWHDYKQMELDKRRKGEGEAGMPVALAKDPETAKLEDQIYRVNGFDGLVSDHISLSRSIKDLRHPKCKQKKYIPNLPNVGVIFPFHNEHNTTLIRGVYSVINRSPPELLKEIILVDDCSTKEFLKKPLDDFLKAAGIDDIVKVVRLPKREGLIRAREKGAEAATADVIVFLDSHSECNYNWLPPLLEPIALNYRTVVCPFVDVVDCDTFEYKVQDNGARGSFDWEFSYKRLPLPKEDLVDPVKPFKSPIMAGGYFAISRKWFWELGGYDEGLDIWGGEQYELSFKVWQCHGEMVDAPCSRVGHIYRCKYVPFPNPGVGDFISRNYKRVAEVWMDEYKEHLYKRKPVMRDTETGDLTKQLAVREKLKCKSFDWFMKNVAWDQDKFYPAVEPPDAANGEIRNVADTNKCIDTQFKGKEEVFGLRPCMSDNPSGGGEQNMRFSFWKDIRPMSRSMCWDCSTTSEKAPVVMFPCHGMQGNQQWKYNENTQQITHANGFCLDCDAERGEIFMNPCDDSKKSQKWKWQNWYPKVFNSWKY